MEGQGVTNYSVSGRASYGYTAETTEFDDALIQRGVVTHEQAIMAKGATWEQAQALVQQHNNNKQSQTELQVDDWYLTSQKEDDSGNDEDSCLDSDIEDGDFMEQYRQQRIREMQQQQAAAARHRFGRVYPIDRPQWQAEVNLAENCWVVVCLTSHDVERTGMVEAAVAELATRHGTVKFVSIPYLAAIDHWPHEQLPTLFCYRDGKMQHSLITLPIHTTAPQLETLLRNKGVLLVTNDDSVEDDDDNDCHRD